MKTARVIGLCLTLVVLLGVIVACATPPPTATPPRPTQAPPPPTKAPEPTKAPVAQPTSAPITAPAATKAPEPTKAVAPAAPNLKGIKLTLLIHPTLYSAAGGKTGITAEFEQATGATVEVVTAPIPEHSEKALVEFLAGSGRYDVIAMQNSDMTKQLNQYYLPLDKYIQNDKQAWEWGDIIPSLSAYFLFDGKQLGVPYRWGTNMLYYRKDLLDAAGVKPPKTMDELVAAAKKLTKVTGDPKTDVYGFVARGKPTEIAHDWLGLFYGAGGDMITKDNKCGLSSPAAVKATNTQLELWKAKAMQPDFFAWGRDDIITGMQQGRVAMGIYVSSYWGRLIDPKDSKVADKLGWALPPSEAGVAPGRTRGGGWGLVVNKFSKNPDAAWELVKALTSKPNSIREAVQWANGPIRTSTFESPEYLKLFPLAKDWLVGTASSAVDPAIPIQPQILDVITEEVTAMMNNEKNVDKGLSDMCRRVDKLIADSK